MREAREWVTEIERERDRQLPRLLDELAGAGVRIIPYSDLDEAERDAVRRHYIDNIFPLVTPQVIDPAHPFPFISNLS